MSAQKETLEIPDAIRTAVDERDGGFCRLCGEFLGERRALHHIFYGGVGRRRHHAVDEIISLGWLYESDCHSVVHSDKRLWQPLLAELVHRPGVTGLQLLRWKRSNARWWRCSVGACRQPVRVVVLLPEGTVRACEDCGEQGYPERPLVSAF